MTKTLEAASDEYLAYLRTTKAKSPLTVDKETYALAKWSASMGALRINKLGLTEIREFVSERADEGVSNRTINLDVQALHNLLSFFRASGKLPAEKLPTEIWPRLKHTAPRRELIPDDAVDRICRVCEGRPGGQFISDYVKLLAYSGARKRAALSARWGDVNWDSKVFTYRSKFDKIVHVNLNPSLEAHLRDFHARSAGKNQAGDFMFPGDHSCGYQVEPQARFAELRALAGLPEVTLHDFRHYFISKAVMAGLDVLTVARWVGHADGGVLIGKIYGHLANEHLQRSARRLTFTNAAPEA